MIWELSTTEGANPLRPVRAYSAVASENAADTDSMVKEVSGLGSGEVVIVIIGLLPLDFHHPRTSKSLPVEAKVATEASQLVSEQTNELDGVWSDIGVVLAILEETDYGSGQQVLENGISGDVQWRSLVGASVVQGQGDIEEIMVGSVIRLQTGT